MAAQSRVGSARGLACARLFVGWHHPRGGEAAPSWGRNHSRGTGQGQQPLWATPGPLWATPGPLQATRGHPGAAVAVKGLLAALWQLSRQQHSDSSSLCRHALAADTRVPGRRPVAPGLICRARSWSLPPAAGSTRQPERLVGSRVSAHAPAQALGPAVAPRPRRGAAAAGRGAVSTSRGQRHLRARPWLRGCSTKMPLAGDPSWAVAGAALATSPARTAAPHPPPCCFFPGHVAGKHASEPPLPGSGWRQPGCRTCPCRS